MSLQLTFEEFSRLSNKQMHQLYGKQHAASAALEKESLAVERQIYDATVTDKDELSFEQYMANIEEARQIIMGSRTNKKRSNE